MLQALKNQSNFTHTENGALTYSSTLNHNLNLFASIGALRNAGDDEIIARFLRAFSENADLAMKVLFYARDVRGGLGERRVFRLILSWLAENEPRVLKKNIPHIALFGRWDDLLTLLGTKCETDALHLIRNQLDKDLEDMAKGNNISLLAKWLPSINTSCRETVEKARRIARYLGMDSVTYRKTLSTLRKYLHILENDLRVKDYSFDYSKQPSRAMFKYRAAFSRNDGVRYRTFMEKVRNGEATLHMGSLTPYDIISPMLRDDVTEEDRYTADVTWKALEDFGCNENALVVVDGSGSMYCGNPTPAAVAMSLGIYFAQRNTGAFHGHFITFSENPQLVMIQGSDLLEQVRYCMSYNEVANTNLARVFQLLLSAAVQNQIPQEEMPAKLYIISDMEFDNCMEGADLTNFQYARALFESHGYHLPQVVFWNVNSRSRQFPVTANEQGAILVSGCTPRLFASVTEGYLSPLEYMLEVLHAPRYQCIAA